MSRSTRRLEVVCPRCRCRFYAEPDRVVRFLDRAAKRDRGDSVRRLKRRLR
ncbi:MAG: hypothetical protein O3A46_05705 [Candidatus Poribacteria bacterium]|nr:hypothetical protein [Candidatus Poribacteria bacterium]